MFKNFTIKTKVIILLVVSLSLLTVVLATFSVTKAKESLLNQNYAMLTSARDSKANQVTNFFAERIGDIKVLSESSNIKDLVYDLQNMYDLVDVDDNGNFPVDDMIVKSSTKEHERFFPKIYE